MTDRDLAQKIAAFWDHHGFAVWWTDGKEGPDAKRCKSSWDKAVPVRDWMGYGADLGSIAGQIGLKLESRNPVIVSRNSGLVLIDCDGYAQISEFLSFSPPDTLAVESSLGKRHFYFRPPEPDPPYSYCEFGPGGVTCKRNQYLVMPPALHPGGWNYRWLNNLPIATLPMRLYEQLYEASQQSRRQQREAVAGGEKVGAGGRHQYLLSLIGGMVRSGVPQEQALVAALAANQENCDPPAPEKHVRERVEDLYGRYEVGAGVREHAERRVEDDELAAEVQEEAEVAVFLRDEFGLAEGFADTHAGEARVDSWSEEWMTCQNGIWDDRGGRLKVERLMQDYLRARIKAARTDKDFKWANSVQRTASMNSVLTSSRSRMVIPHEELDADPLLLACANGTLELGGGVLREHRPMDYITRSSPVEYDPAAQCPRWELFLREVFLDDEDLIAYLHRLCGYILTGLNTEHLFWVLHGSGGNGKGTFLRPWRFILGQMCDTLKYASLASAAKQDGRAANSDIAKLDRVRLALVYETDENQLDETLVKSITGGDDIAARFLYKNEFTFRPTFKIWMATNKKPKISADPAMARRVQLVPFTRHFTRGGDADGGLEAKLLAEAPGILAWAVRGWQAYQAAGLGSCAAVEDASRAYLEGANPLSEWVEANCALGAGLTATGRDLLDSYRLFCINTGTQSRSDEEYSASLEALGCRRNRSNKGMTWHGITLVDSAPVKG